ncbi:dihydrolipoyl dehydrogenase family protein [Atopobium fossor]|uniref:dihydrolipoyl dehydrogenase family protein n=1 Tax=Atopobium fossor TaxID=39487 RepID=UPI0004271F7B|nr:NAD(P)/FAD-dependent oxidoreductase [Atopobium fossor]
MEQDDRAEQNVEVFDLLVIGFGKAGKTIAMKRAKAGDRVALVERDAAMYGGTCINIGCVPTKTLLTDAARYAFVQGDGASAFSQAQVRRNELIAKLNAANLNMVKNAGVEVVDGIASFTGPHTVQVKGVTTRILEAKKIIINTGSTTRMPSIPGIESARVYTSTTIQHIDTLPGRLVIVGGGPIGLEFATLFSGFGSQVTVLDMHPSALGIFDEDVAACALEVFAQRGVTFRTSAEPTSFEDGPDTITIKLKDGSKLQADAVLIAAGRIPATSELNLAQAGIEITQRGAIKVDEHLRTNVDGIWAAGDVNGGPQFTYISFDDHRIIMADAWLQATQSSVTARTATGRLFPTTTFIEPPLATVGISEKQAQAKQMDYVVKKGLVANMPIVPRPKILGQADGMVKFILDPKTDRILGATLFCTDAQELINTVAVAMQSGMTATELGAGIYTHPSSSEVFNAVLGL